MRKAHQGDELPEAWACVEAVARRRNYRRAALELGVSQSQLSRIIQALEWELGLSLFERTRQGVTVTPSGTGPEGGGGPDKGPEAFAAGIAAIRDATKDVLRIGCGAFVSQTWAPSAIADLARTRPEISISMRELDWWRLADAALGDEFHLVFGETSDAERAPEIVIERFPERHGGLFVRSGHRLSGRNDITLDTIAAFPLASPGCLAGSAAFRRLGQSSDAYRTMVDTSCRNSSARRRGR